MKIELNAKIQRLRPYAPFLLFLAFTLALLSPFFIHYPLGYDAAYFLEAPRNLYLFGKYQSNYTLFDNELTTGFPVLVPIYICFVLFGMGLVQAKIVMLGYLVLFLATLYYLYQRYFNQKLFSLVSLALSIALFCAFVPEPFRYVVDVMGELPAWLFLFTAVICFEAFRLGGKRRYLVGSGLLLGLSIATKLVMLIGVVPFLLYLATDLKQRQYLSTTIKTGLFLLCASLPLVFFNIYKLSVLGLTTYLPRMRESILRVIRNEGSGLDHAPSFYNNFLEHIMVIDTQFYIHPVGFLAGVILVLYSAYRFYQQKQHVLVMLLIFFFVYSFWWFFLNQSFWARHYLPALVIVLILLPIILTDLFKRFKSAKSLTVILCVGLILTNLPLLKKNLDLTHYIDLTKQQSDIAAYINDKVSSETRIYNRAVWRAPEISFLTNRQFLLLDDHKPTSTDDLIVISTLITHQDRTIFYEDTVYCGEILIENTSWKLCRYNAPSE